MFSFVKLTRIGMELNKHADISHSGEVFKDIKGSVTSSPCYIYFEYRK